MTDRSTTVIMDAQDFDEDLVRRCFAGVTRHRAIIVTSGTDQLDFPLPKNVSRLHLSDGRVKNRAQRINLAAGAAGADGTEFLSLLDGPAELTDEAIEAGLRVIDGPQQSRVVSVLPFVDSGPAREDFAVRGSSGPAFATRPRMSRGRLLTLTFWQWNAVRGLDEKSTVPNDSESELVYRLTWMGNSVKFLPPRHCLLFSIAPGEASAADARFCPPADAVAIRQTRATVEKNKRPIRNLQSWTYPSNPDRPLVSVVISTYNRADYIKDSIDSVLGQTFGDFELIVVDDGSEDETVDVVRSYRDRRVRLLTQENQGIAAARNAAAAVSRGFFTAVHDDDDIMLPERLATSLNAIDDEHHASYGSWVNFDNETAAMVLHTTKQEFIHGTVFTNGQSPGHATWLVPTAYVRRLKYDETLSSAVDHNLSIRMMRSGVKWQHTGKIMFLRRIHPAQVSITDVSRQKFAAHLTRFTVQVPASYENIAELKEKSKTIGWPGIPEKADLLGHLAPYLPDHLVYRTMKVSAAVANKALTLDKLADTGYVLGEVDHDNDRKFETGELLDLKIRDFPVLAEHGITGTIHATLRRDLSEGRETPESGGQWDEAYAVSRAISDRVPTLLKALSRKGREPALLLLPGEADVPVNGAASHREWTVVFGRSQAASYNVLGYEDISEADKRLNELSPELRGQAFLVAEAPLTEFIEGARQDA
ncbi:glycosyltransferase family A protein [Kocuria sp. SM24M-10]|uniref:glycosyltransferase family 2 protein n=1 Tax=Kocuria sp. SM24M-10 TaxID=1660349 RepID=UPI00069ADCF8|nr:glycosyltransferase family A protein [Kocuria sp. SM24M-10]